MRSQKNDERVQWFVWCLNGLNWCPRVEVEQKIKQINIYVYMAKKNLISQESYNIKQVSRAWYYFVHPGIEQV